LELIQRDPAKFGFCTASFPGTETILVQPFCGDFDEIPEMNSGIPAEMELLYQEKEFVAGRMSGNEH